MKRCNTLICVLHCFELYWIIINNPSLAFKAPHIYKRRSFIIKSQCRKTAIKSTIDNENYRRSLSTIILCNNPNTSTSNPSNNDEIGNLNNIDENFQDSADGDYDEDGDMVEIDFNQITDEQILLACRAYLQKRNRLEWKNAKRRKQSSQLVESRRQADETGNNIGYFWENPNELKFLQSSNYQKTDGTATMRNNVEGDNNLDLYKQVQNDETNSFYDSDIKEENHFNEYPTQSSLGFPYTYNSGHPPSEQDDNLGGRPFSYFSGYATQEHINRSLASKRRWDDPEFRKKWYARRWGDESNNPAKDDKQKQREQQLKLVENLSPDLLKSPLLSAMSEDELHNAIVMYIGGNQKRSQSHKERNEGGVKKYVQKHINDGYLTFQHSVNDEALRKRQEKRSQIAKKAYKTRLENVKEKKKQKKTEQDGSKETKKKSYAKSLSSLISSSVKHKSRNKHEEMIKIQRKETIIQIEKCLDNGELPSSLDIEFILVAARIPGRKQLLLRILRECFGLYGKCIPGDPSLEENSKMLFATKCNVDVLGSFILEKLEEKELGSSNL